MRLAQALRILTALTMLLFTDSVIGASPLGKDRRIEEASFVSIGGIQQWVTVRGADRRNPILLIVHGGPGDSQSPFIQTYVPYEQDFVLVQWDQRGAGKTFAPNRNIVKELTLERMAQDGVELTDYLRKHLKQKNIIVLGHSWGTILAIEMVKRRPELFAAYVGTGQMSSWHGVASAQWTYLQEAARAAQDQATLDRLNAIGEPDFLNVNQYFSWRLILNRKYLSPSDAAWLQELRALTSSSGLSDAELKEFAEGSNFSAMQLLKVLMTTDLRATAESIAVPFYVVQGREDMFAATNPAIEYFKSVQAPKKKLVLIEHAGHFALATHPKEFLDALANLGLTRNLQPR